MTPGGSAESKVTVVEHVAEFRGADIPDCYPMREGWRVVCPVHGVLQDGYAYAWERNAKSGFAPHGFDNVPQPRYPFTFTLADVLTLDPAWIAASFVAAHFSPPCQAHSDLQRQSKRFYRDLIPPVRELLEATGLPYVIENVEGAPLRDPVMLCGTMFPGLRVLRHRLFESNFPITIPEHGRHPLVFTHDKRKAHHGKLDQNVSFVQVTGGGNCTVTNARDAMGVDWMTKDELNEALPPAYTEFIGAQLMAEVLRRQEVAA